MPVKLRWMLLGWVCTLGTLAAADWPQFRGLNSSGIAPGDEPLPSVLGPEDNLLWKTSTPSGRSSPIVAGGRVFITATRDTADFVTICLDAASGEILWQQQAPLARLLALAPNGGQSQSSCAADAQHVVSYFGSSGLICYDHEGEQLWYREFEPFNTQFGTGSSPVIVDDKVVLCQDSETDAFLAVLDLATGDEVWRTERGQFSSSFATPVIWDNEGQRQIVVAGSLAVTGYDFATGEQVWTVGGIAWCVVSTPVVGENGLLYVNAASPGEGFGVIAFPPFEEGLTTSDRDGDGSFNRDEFEEFGPRAGFFPTLDRDKDGYVVREEYEYINDLWLNSKDVLLAIRPGGKGDITETHVAWSHSQSLPFVPSPVAYGGHLFTVKDAGVINCLDMETGRPSKRGRLKTRGDYYSSPVIGDGKIYLSNDLGQLSVISAEGRWRELGGGDLGEEVYATPAIADGRIFIRSIGNLYCFGFADFDAELERRANAISPQVWWAAGGAGGCAVVVLGLLFWRLRRKPSTPKASESGESDSED